MSNPARSAIERKIARIPKAEPFSRAELQGTWSSRSIDRTLAALLATGELVRLLPGIYTRPKTSEFTGRTVLPCPNQILEYIVSKTGETLQMHGAEAIRRLGLSTQMQIRPTYYTSGRTRSIMIRRAEIQLIHMSQEVLQHAGTRLGTLISAFHYIDSTQISSQELERILEDLEPDEIGQLLAAKLPVDQMQKIRNWYQGRITH